MTAGPACGPGESAAARDAALAVEWLGRVPYAQALARQLDAVDARGAGRRGDTLFLLEHPPVITLGRSARAANLLVSPGWLAERGIEVHEVARGGDVTLHAPGQLVGYLVMDLAARGRPDLHAFVRGIEHALIDALAELGVPARRVDGRSGVFVAEEGAPTLGERDRKIASIGVGVRRWITFHGFALNSTIDLAGFDAIVPCGLADVEMTSVARELGIGPLGVDERVRGAVTRAFASAFAARRIGDATA